jgi:16S rRNA (uracil1498-N3)-methyltransferase
MGPRGFAESHPGLRSLGILIGPEGGIDPEEIAALPECQPLTLGPRILRTETAGLAAADALLALYGEMETNELS